GACGWKRRVCKATNGLGRRLAAGHVGRVADELPTALPDQLHHLRAVVRAVDRRLFFSGRAWRAPLDSPGPREFATLGVRQSGLCAGTGALLDVSRESPAIF